jgi:hypothetical protein
MGKGGEMPGKQKIWRPAVVVIIIIIIIIMLPTSLPLATKSSSDMTGCTEIYTP